MTHRSRTARLLTVVAAVLPLAACVVRVNRANTAPAPAGDVTREIIALETRWNDAIVAKDTVTVSRILADDFVYVAPNGYVAKRAELMAVVADPNGRQDPFTTKDVVVRRYGDAVVVTGWFRQRGTSGASRYDSHVRYTDVYVWRDGRWQAVSAHASTLPKAPDAG